LFECSVAAERIRVLGFRAIRRGGRSALRAFGSLARQAMQLTKISRDEDSGLPALAGDMRRIAPLFDIVNGFF